MFNAENALYNAGTFGSAMPRAPIRLVAVGVCQATHVVRFAAGVSHLSVSASMGLAASAHIRGVRRLVAAGVGELVSGAVVHRLHPSRVTARAVLMLQSEVKVHRAAHTPITGTAGLASVAVLSKKQRMQIHCVGRLESVARAGASNADTTPEDRTFSLRTQDNNFVLGEGAMSLIGVINKQPADRRDYDVDCTSLVGDYDVVQTATATASPAGLTVDAPTVFSDHVKLWIGGGTDGATYKVTVTVFSRDGRIQQDEIRVKVKEV